MGHELILVDVMEGERRTRNSAVVFDSNCAFTMTSGLTFR